MLQKAIVMCLLCLGAAYGCSSKSMPSAAGAISTIPADELGAAASAQAARLLEKIPPGMERLYGFEGRDQMARAVPGRAWRVFTAATPGQGRNSGETGSIKALDQYRVTLIADGRPRALLTMEIVDGRPVATALGAAVLAGELDETSSRLGGRYRSAPIGRLLRLYGIKGDFLLPDADAPDGDVRVVPLKSARINLGIDRPEPVETTLEQLDPAIRQAALKGDQGI